MKRILIITCALALFSCTETVYKSEITVTYSNGQKETFIYDSHSKYSPVMYGGCIYRFRNQSSGVVQGSIRCGVRSYSKKLLTIKSNR